MKFLPIALAALAGLASAQIHPRPGVILTDINTTSTITSFSNIVQTEDDVSVVVYNDANGLQAFASDGQAIAWTGPVVISSDTTARPRISTVQIVGQNVVVVYTDGTNNLNCAVSTDGGLTFGAPVAVTNSSSVDPQAYALAAGNFGPGVNVFGIYIAYVDTVTSNAGTLRFTQSLDGGQTFTSPIVVTSNPQTLVDRVDIFAEAAFVGVAFRSNGDVFVQRSTDTGQTFAAQDILVSAGPGTADGFEIDIFGRSNRVAVFWQENTVIQAGVDPTDIVGAVSTDFASTFGAETVVARAIDIDEARFGAFTGPNLVIVYEDFTTSEVTARTSTNNGASFLPAVQLSTSALGGGSFPNLGASDDTVAVTWNNNPPGGDQAVGVISRNNGLSWTTEQFVGEFELNGVVSDFDFTRIEYNSLYDNVVMVSRVDGDFLNGAGATSEIFVHGFRRAFVQEQGFSSRTGPLQFQLDGFGQDTVAFVLLSVAPPASSPFLGDPLNRSSFFVFDGLTTQLIFFAPLATGAGTTNSLANPLPFLPTLNVNVQYVGIGFDAAGTASTISDVRSVGI